MTLNNGKWKFGTAGNDTFDMITDQPLFWNVADNYDAGAGADRVYGNLVDNTIRLGAGDDRADGRWGDDTIYGGLNRDVIYGDRGSDKLYGEEGVDLLYGGEGGDRLYGGSDSDLLMGDDGSDTLDGGTGSDQIYGGKHNDTLGDGSTEAVLDRLEGGEGDDSLVSSGGGDVMLGGSGYDTFSIGSASTFRVQGGSINGGSDTDTLVLRSATDVGVFGNIASIEKFDLRATSAQTLQLNFDEIRDISSTDKLTVYGGAQDTILLDDTVTNDPINGGRWQLDAVSNPTSTGERYHTWEYHDGSGDLTGIQLIVNANVDVNLV